MAGTPAYKNNWTKENRGRINLTVSKGQKAVIQAHAAAHGESLTGFIDRAISKTMERDQMCGQDKEELIHLIQEYRANMEEREIEELVVALAILESQASGITDFFLSKIKPREPKKWTLDTL